MDESLLPPPIGRALVRVVDLLDPLEVEWLVVGSVAAALHGVPIVPRDIDIWADVDAIYVVERALGETMAAPVHYWASEAVHSHFGQAVIEGVRVDLVGGLEVRSGPECGWQSPLDLGDEPLRRAVANRFLRIPSSRSLALMYERLGNAPRAQLLRRRGLSA